MNIDFEKQDLSHNQNSQLSSATLATEGYGGPERKEGLTRMAKFSRYFQVNITTRNADLLLLTCCLISGLTDSSIYNGMPASFFAQVHPSSTRTKFLLDSVRHICIHANWYVIDISIKIPRPSWEISGSVSYYFESNLGNTVFVGLGGSNGKKTYKPYGWVKSFTSIVCFIIGSLFFSRLSRFLGPLRRTTLVSSFVLQALLILITAAIIEAGLIEGRLDHIPNDIDWKQEIAIGLLSFQSAGQIVGSRALGLSEIPTVVVTSVLCDFASDPEIARPLTANVKRNRRALAFLGILAGAVAGGWLSKVTGQMQTALWVAGGIKAAVVAAWICWPRTPPTQGLDWEVPQRLRLRSRVRPDARLD